MRDHIKRFREALEQSQIVAKLVAAFAAVMKALKTLKAVLAKFISSSIRPFIQYGFTAVNSLRLMLQSKGYSINQVFSVLLFMLIAAEYGFGQGTGLEEIDISTPTALFGNIEALYGVLVIVGGYLSAFIPGLKKIDDGAIRVFTWALITGIGFALFSGTEVLNLSITYAVSTSLYEIILRWFRKSPAPETATKAAEVKALATLTDMARSSLDPGQFDNWEKIKSSLELTRGLRPDNPKASNF